jgi:sulfite reductase alpha subunit-like flavoprotein
MFIICLTKKKKITIIISGQTGKAQKRAEHNAIERARRESLNTMFQQLAHTLPNLQDDRRPSKGTIIERTLEFGKYTSIKQIIKQ